MELKRCARCALDLDRSLFGRDKNRRDGLNVYCRQCANAKSARYAADNLEAVRRNKLAYDRRNKDRIQKWRSENADMLRAYWRRYGKWYRAEKPGETAAKTRRQQAARRRAVPPWFDPEKAEAIYRQAAQLRATGLDVHVDHIVPIHGDGVCGLHWHENLQILTAFENLSKGNRWSSD